MYPTNNIRGDLVGTRREMKEHLIRGTDKRTFLAVHIE